uniref:Uncharacterized protein n=1 Tax=Panagrolaimus davidi TaxID=227884 RepID=A0A914PBS6_9BILA
MDDSIYLTPYELQLRSENEKLKKQLKEMGELYSEEEEKHYQTNQILLADQKELKEKIQALENRMAAADCFLSTSTCSLQNEHDSSLYHTLSKDYAELQKNFQSVCDEKFELEAEIEEKKETIKKLQKVVLNLSLKNYGNEELQGIIEELQQKNFALEELIKKLNYNIHEMAEVNRDLQNRVCSLQNQIDNLQFCKVFDEPPITLFDELEGIKQDDESEVDKINAENNIVQNALEFNDYENEEVASTNTANEPMSLNENVQVALDLSIDVEFLVHAEDLQEDILLAEKSIPFLLPENVKLKSSQNFTEPYCLKCGSNSISTISLPFESFNDNMETNVSSTVSLPTLRNFEHKGDFIDVITNAQCRRINDQRCNASILKDVSNNRRTETPRVSTSKLLGSFFLFIFH